MKTSRMQMARNKSPEKNKYSHRCEFAMKGRSFRCQRAIFGIDKTAEQKQTHEEQVTHTDTAAHVAQRDVEMNNN
jgi:hypothetical protein